MAGTVLIRIQHISGGILQKRYCPIRAERPALSDLKSVGGKQGRGTHRIVHQRNTAGIGIGQSFHYGFLQRIVAEVEISGIAHAHHLIGIPILQPLLIPEGHFQNGLFCCGEACSSQLHIAAAAVFPFGAQQNAVIGRAVHPFSVHSRQVKGESFAGFRGSGLCKVQNGTFKFRLISPTKRRCAPGGVYPSCGYIKRICRILMIAILIQFQCCAGHPASVGKRRQSKGNIRTIGNAVRHTGVHIVAVHSAF